MYRKGDTGIEVFLVHPGGPFWAKKDLGAWSVPKGELTIGEDPLEAAKREFTEETGCTAEGNFLALTPVKQKGGKMVYAWAVQGNCDQESIQSNTFIMEWPPRSGKKQEFPEIDRAEWFPLDKAREKILKSQVNLLDDLYSWLKKN